MHLAIYDVAGRLVRSLVAGRVPAGYHATVWDGKDDRGHAVASGVYLYRLEAQGKVLTRKLMALR